MSSLHDQAMHHIYQQVLERVTTHLPRAQQASLKLLIHRLVVAAGGEESIGRFRLVLLHGGDRRSAQLLACLRAAQLTLALRYGSTFRLRVVVACVPVMDLRTLRKHDYSFSALVLQDDPRVELLMLEDDKLVPFSCRPSEPAPQWSSAREAMLLFGHLAEATPAALFGARLHVQLAAALPVALEGSDALVTALSDRQRYRFLAWGRRIMRLGKEPGVGYVQRCAASLAHGLGRLQRLVAEPMGRLVTAPPALVGEQRVNVLAIGHLLCPSADMQALDDMLGVRYEPGEPKIPLATCCQTQLIQNLCKLKTQLFAVKDRGTRLSLKNTRLDWWLRAQQQVRASFMQVHGLDETQLACLLLAPFGDHGRDLSDFLRRCHPCMQVALPYLHKALQGKPCPDAVKRWLVDTSGLSLTQLQAIYAGRLSAPARRVLTSLVRRDIGLRLLPGRAPVPATVRQAAP